ncbi:MAG TPA: BTAD domain-containing putative transcriptional regulator, partial [Anaerolineae bacterium]|nr:BTAD domain-containing putative transcriptional regulator [Anaerolineae bacterium]
DLHHLWRRIQNLLGWASAPPSSQQEAPAERARTPAASFVEQTVVLAAPLIEQVEASAVSPVENPQQAKRELPALAVYCLGSFRAYQDGELITHWPNGKGKTIFKYMVTHRSRPVPKDILMDLFWRDADPEAARKNLNVAIYSLRQAFRAVRPDFSPVLFQDDAYLLNPAMAVWVDVEEFEQYYEAGQSFERGGKLPEAVREYELAENLYQGDFLEEDLYEDWPILQRESVKDNYLVILERLGRYYLEEKSYATCIHLCQKILAKDDCREDAHRRLMQCYSRQGQPNLALRQYQLCVEALAKVLDMSPAPETVKLYRQIRNREGV